MVLTLRGFVHKIIAREEYHPVLTYPLFLLRVLIVRARYHRTLERLRRKVASGDKLKVVFLSMDVSKWKCQSLYDLMRQSTVFDPVIALTMTDEDENHTAGQIEERNRQSRMFYERFGCRVEEACDPITRRVRPLSELDADIVFYQVPWGNLSPQTVLETSRSALCCYVPYSIDTIDVCGKSRHFGHQHMANFHAILYAIFQWSEAYAKSYQMGLRSFEWAGRTYGFGYPALDVYSDSGEGGGAYVIYAPHFAFAFNGKIPVLNIGTFNWSGRLLLEYAQAHRDIKWVFKPHPKLRERLVEIGYMTQGEVDAYYAAWEKLGVACYDGDYAKWFKTSRAMITDSNSFLMEYMAVGKPLIHLVPVDDNTVACPEAEEVFRTFYVAKNENELSAHLRLVVEDGQDPRCDERQAAARAACVLGNHAGRRIFDWLLNEVKP